MCGDGLKILFSCIFGLVKILFSCKNVLKYFLFS